MNLKKLWDIISIVPFILISIIILDRINTPMIILSVFFLCVYIYLFMKLKKIKILKEKIPAIIIFMIIVLKSYNTFYTAVFLEIPYIKNSLEIKKEISKRKKFFHNDKEISIELKEEIEKKFTYKEIFFGNLSKYSGELIGDEYLIDLDGKFKIKIISSILDGTYIKISYRYYKKIDTKLDFNEEQ